MGYNPSPDDKKILLVGVEVEPVTLRVCSGILTTGLQCPSLFFPSSLCSLTFQHVNKGVAESDFLLFLANNRFVRKVTASTT